MNFFDYFNEEWRKLEKKAFRLGFRIKPLFLSLRFENWVSDKFARGWKKEHYKLIKSDSVSIFFFTNFTSWCPKCGTKNHFQELKFFFNLSLTRLAALKTSLSNLLLVRHLSLCNSVCFDRENTLELCLETWFVSEKHCPTYFWRKLNHPTHRYKFHPLMENIDTVCRTYLF